MPRRPTRASDRSATLAAARLHAPLTSTTAAGGGLGRKPYTTPAGPTKFRAAGRGPPAGPAAVNQGTPGVYDARSGTAGT